MQDLVNCTVIQFTDRYLPHTERAKRANRISSGDELPAGLTAITAPFCRSAADDAGGGPTYSRPNSLDRFAWRMLGL
jgi:hypothetical protein